MSDHFDAATAAAHRCAQRLIKQDTPPVIIADGLITQALAVWAADSGRPQSAQTVLRIWAAVRDAES